MTSVRLEYIWFERIWTFQRAPRASNSRSFWKCEAIRRLFSVKQPMDKVPTTKFFTRLRGLRGKCQQCSSQPRTHWTLGVFGYEVRRRNIAIATATIKALIKGRDWRKTALEFNHPKFRESKTQISSKSWRSKECSWRHCSLFGGKSSKGTFSEIFGGQWSKISVECGFMHLPALQIAVKNQLQECLWPVAFQFVEMKPLVWVWVWITFKLCIANHNRKDPYECLWVDFRGFNRRGAKRFPRIFAGWPWGDDIESCSLCRFGGLAERISMADLEPIQHRRRQHDPLACLW